MKRILLIVGGGIAAYKSCELVRLLRKRGHAVRCVLTEGASHFVTPMTLAALSEDRVYSSLWDLKDEHEMGHIQLSREADLVVVAPATADLLARMAGGQAGDLATTVLLATDKPVLAAPAMNWRMWLHPATARNVARLRADGVRVMEPDEGAMACGEWGPGRLPEPPAILDAIEAMLTASAAVARAHLAHPTPVRPELVEGSSFSSAGEKQDDPSTSSGRTEVEGPDLPLADRHALVTAGPTHEPIDPVRYLANRSSGRQGFAVAGALAALGARVTLVAGPVALPTPAGVERVDVETAREMAAAVEAALPADVAVMVAAVADWRVEAAAHKTKKGDAPPALSLVENPDILAALARSALRPMLLIGFAAETERVVEHAVAKRVRKGADWIVANDVSGDVMGGDANAVHLVTADGVEDWPRSPKEAVAARLADRIAAALTA
ncbi:bifunctional phosphopantothenoylcysteine decarboxylase/phosphopantothenate synthase [uncultured Sphingomonas sp.]|uniref:bifunctional phosphopantothenoylcysteine decarboxylase/phosphopantothenate synthase n=1 Tax=uncultured Sphingomonas sp. TaxID=158754 RepID=UPI0035CC1FDD